ncbi:MAG: ATP-binding protein [Gammaproteobacteria bacterium]|nr:ATP-binding protein [Gammaproteobacteria bacterium]
MIRKVIIRNIKKFGQQEFEIPKHLVIAGPNNYGKTTVLQAVAAWSEIAVQELCSFLVYEPS